MEAKSREVTCPKSPVKGRRGEGETRGKPQMDAEWGQQGSARTRRAWLRKLGPASQDLAQIRAEAAALL